VRIQPLSALGEDGEALLRMRALGKARNVERGIEQIRQTLKDGKLSVACLYDDGDAPRGLVAWRWQDNASARAQVILLYMQPIAPPSLGEALVDYVFSELTRVNALQVIEARMRDDSPGVRAAWARRDAAFFERCRMVLLLGRLPLPIVPTPDGYRMVRWEEQHQSQAEQVAITAHDGEIDAVAVPDTGWMTGSLRKLRAGEVAGIGTWNPDASLVAIDKRERVAGYIAIATSGSGAHVVDLSVHSSHRRRGLARSLLIRSMRVCLKQGLSTVSAAVTTRNPVRQLYNQLGFQSTDCGEVAIWWRDRRQLAWRE
jgi:ribosomal protein S18 acetylase RimI-like enzyme